MERASAVVVNHDGGEQILRCLAQLQAQRPWLAEAIVVDNGSTDGSPEAIRLRFPDVVLVELGQNLGPAAARNEGLRRVASASVLLVDDDVYLTPDCLRLLLEARAREGAAAVVPRLVLLPESHLIQADGCDVHFVGTMRLRQGRVPLTELEAESASIVAFSSSCALVDRERLREAGGFDESYFIYLEDMELGLRLASFGERLVCEPAAIAHHERGAGTPGLSFRDRGEYPRRRAYLTMRNRLRSVLLHYRMRSLLVLAPALALYELASLAFALRRGWLGLWLRAWGWQLWHLRETFGRRRWIQARRRVEDAQLLVGGPLPLAPGLLLSSLEARAVQVLTWMLDGYWRLARSWLPGAEPSRSADAR